MARPAGEPGPTSTATASTDDAGNPAAPNLQEYADLTSDREWPWIYRMLVCQLLRDLHAAPADVLRSIVEQEPGTKTWDDWHVLLAAAVEFACADRGIPIPDWVVDERLTRDEIWCPGGTDEHGARHTWAPAAFLRHGAIPDPKEFDKRCGTHDGWEPDR